MKDNYFANRGGQSSCEPDCYIPPVQPGAMVRLYGDWLKVIERDSNSGDWILHKLDEHGKVCNLFAGEPIKYYEENHVLQALVAQLYLK